jgi:hypothetical protein
MADPKTEQTADFRRTLDEGQGVGQNADGTFDTFPVADLAKRTAERDSDEAATQHAMEQSEEGFPPEPEEDFADLEDAE